ncbi:MAG: NADH-quinone oxidoreductase subunit F, partial [Caldisericales bacterium]|nr:NADH-quinone oxidoreductase subunit F [Caldisericales bacterium]
MQTATDFALTKENLGAYLTGSLSGDSAKVIEAILSKLKREDVSKPTIYVGTGTCGLGAGAGKTLEAIKAYLAEKNIDADIVQIGCIGLCAEEPMVDFQLPGRTRISFRKITEDKVPQLMDAMLAGNVPEDLACFQFRSKTLKGWNNVKYMDEHPFFASQTRWVLAGCGIVDPTNIWEYIASDGYKAFAKAIYDKTRQEVCDMVEKSGLRGRGGGGFNTGTKWKLALQQEADQKYMICNADEGDPGAFMDRAVIEGDPHRMIEGLAIAAYAIGASKAYVYLRA